MSLLPLAVLYLMIGIGLMLALCLRQSRGQGRAVDQMLLLCAWPLYAPFVLAQVTTYRYDGLSPSEVSFLAALRRARDTPLAALLPDESTVRHLGRRLRVATQRLQEIDGLLAQPAFDHRAAEARVRELEQQTHRDSALATARMRLANIGRLSGMRQKTSAELEEIGEMLLQLRTQVEVLRLSGDADDETRQLISDLLGHVEGMNYILDEDWLGGAARV